MSAQLKTWCRDFRCVTCAFVFAESPEYSPCPPCPACGRRNIEILGGHVEGWQTPSRATSCDPQPAKSADVCTDALAIKSQACEACEE